MNMRRTLLSLVLAVSAATAFSQTSAPRSTAPARATPASAPASEPSATVTQPAVTGKTLDGKPFDLAKLKGRVVLLMFWSTECAVCRDKMPELRENSKGWADKPFTPVLVSVDRRMSNIDSYNAIINKSVPLKERLTQVWALDPSYQDNLGTVRLAPTVPVSHWPVIYVIDKDGKVASRHQGRVPADVWDDIAGLL
jgi:cytochrome oxidase Cu insertion factor (SCO1/SenC/PrrC family)